MNDVNKTKLNIRWEAWEFKAHKKSTIWYIGFTLVTLALLIYGWYSKNFLTMFTFLILAGAWLFYSMQTPRRVTHEVTTTGINVSESIVYPFKNIKKFWIIYNTENKTLNFETTAYLNNHVSLELGRQNPSDLKNFLKQYITEDIDREESFTDVLARKVKF